MFENDYYELPQQKNGSDSTNFQPQTDSYALNSQIYESSHVTQPQELNQQSEKKKRSKPKALIAALVVCGMIGSAGFGFAGAFLANSFAGTSDISGTDSTAILYQSVIKTSSGNKQPEKMSVEDVVANVKQSVVEITTETVSTGLFMREFVSTGAGSGVVISTDGYIITNNHVIDGAQTIKVRLSSGEEFEAKLVGADAKGDIAVIKIEASGLQPAVMGHSSELLVGQAAVAIGNPLGELGGTVTSGIISALDREITIDGETMSLLQTDTAINPGNSGGGLFNLYGELVGIVNAKSSGSEIEGLGFAIPIDTAKTVVEQLIEFGYVRGRIDSGFSLIDIQDPQTAMKYRVNHLGLYISESANAAFQPGDRITAVGDKTVESLADWNRHISGHKVGDTVSVTFVRSGKIETASLTFGELKS